MGEMEYTMLLAGKFSGLIVLCRLFLPEISPQ